MDKGIFGIIVLSFFLVTFITSGCDSIINHTDLEDKQLIEIVEEEKTESEKKVESYNVRLKKFKSFLNESKNIDNKHKKDIERLMEEFKNEDSLKKKIGYAEILIERYNEYIKDFVDFASLEVKIQFVNYLEDACYYKTDSLIKKASFFLYVSKLEEKNKLEQIGIEAAQSSNNYQKEIESLKNFYNEEADRLGLPIPFP